MGTQSMRILNNENRFYTSSESMNDNNDDKIVEKSL